jgi:hypothetical protein
MESLIQLQVARGPRTNLLNRHVRDGCIRIIFLVHSLLRQRQILVLLCRQEIVSDMISQGFMFTIEVLGKNTHVW